MGVEDVEVQTVSSSQVCKGIAIQVEEKGCLAGRLSAGRFMGV